MRARPLSSVRSISLRVALIATAIVAAVYLVISVTVALVVTSRLIGDVDGSLLATLSRIEASVGSASQVPTTQRLSSPQYIWEITPDGTQRLDILGHQFGPTPQFALPAAAQVPPSSPKSIKLNGTSFRIVGTTLTIQTTVVDPATGALTEASTPVRFIVGQPLTTVDSAQGNIILAEGVIGPVLLVAVFLGALAIGRRVASPIERARVRQLEFTADASHELRTPLSVIEAQTSLALSEPRTAEWYRAAFQRVQGEGGRMRHLVEDLLWLARFDSTRRSAQAEHVDVAVMAHQAADRFLAIAEAKGVRLSVRTAPMPLIVHVPPDWLDRLLGVLLDNACKYVPEAGAVDVTVRQEGNRIRLGVDDSGPGIPPEERPRIFDRFHRATDLPGGAGLGLAIANSVVQATGGRWIIGDSPLGGMSMGVTWPRSLAGASQAAAPLPELPEPVR